MIAGFIHWNEGLKPFDRLVFRGYRQVDEVTMIGWAETSQNTTIGTG